MKIIYSFAFVFIFLTASLSFSQTTVSNTSVVANCGCPGELWSFTVPYKPKVFFPSVTNSKRLMHTEYGFNIPASATITGVKVEFVYNCALTPAGTLRDTLVTLFYNNLLLGEDKCGSTGFYSGTGTIVLGGQNDLWGLPSLSPDFVNTTGFGFNFKLYAGVANSDLNFENGAIMTIYYNLANGIKESQSSGSGIKAYVKDKQLLVQSLSTEKTSVEIFDLTGKQVIRSQFEQGNNHTIELSTLPQGVYVYSIESEGRKRTGKFVVE